MFFVIPGCFHLSHPRVLPPSSSPGSPTFVIPEFFYRGYGFTQNLVLSTFFYTEAREILDFVEFIGMKQNRSGMVAPDLKKERLRSLRAACGIWKNRNDLPEFTDLRREWDRTQGERT